MSVRSSSFAGSHECSWMRVFFRGTQTVNDDEFRWMMDYVINRLWGSVVACCGSTFD